MRLLPHHFPCPVLRNVTTVFLQPKDAAPVAYQVEAVRPHRPFVLLKLKGVNSTETTRALVGAELAVKEHDLPPLAHGEFYYY